MRPVATHVPPPPVPVSFTRVMDPRSGREWERVGVEPDIAMPPERALDAAHAAAPAWGKTSAAERAVILNKIADRIEENLESIALAESWDNGKPIRETLNA
ncbi:MAG TPA: aldehyde dehydrogenase family protein, partial [Gemmatimonadales bacterium]|nr:aldehyde dehydrogenase family protein [Gemmatimonadales bacterium]